MRKASSGAPGPPRLALPQALLANALILLFLLGAAYLQSADSDLYYSSVQEDGALEWMTFWAFFLAAGLFAFLGSRGVPTKPTSPWRGRWFLWGLALFCFFVAMEEISWAQRVLGYRPPSYFLGENFQQELNVHNVFSTALRKFSLKAVILGYGVALPLLAPTRPFRKLFSKLGIVSPPPELVPAFFATFLAYQIYPWQFSGEIVEVMLGVGFLFSAIAVLPPSAKPGAGRGVVLRLTSGFALAALLGFATVFLTRLQVRDDPETIAAARAEIGALAQDFRRRGRPVSRCGIHKRVYTYVEAYDKDELTRGRFANLTARGLPEERAAYFIDPWNTPIWIRHKCSKDRTRQRAFVYSFGPDRQRDSSSWEIRGDDVSAMFFAIGD